MDCIRKQRFITTGRFTTLVLLFLTIQASAQGQTAVVRLRESSKPSRSIVLLEDIADIMSTDAAFAARLAKIDLLEIGPSGLSTIIPRKQVDIRLRIEGISPAAYQLVGATDITVFPMNASQTFVRTATQLEPAIDTSETLEQRLLNAAHEQLVSRLQLPKADIKVRLVQPLPNLPGKSNNSIDQVEVVLGQSSSRGTYRPRVYLRQSGVLKATWTIPIEVTQFREVVEATRMIPAGTALTQENTRQIRRDILDVAQLVTARDLAGTVAQQNIQPGDPIRFRQLRAAPKAETAAIRRNDTVQIIAKKGGLQVTVNNGQAMHDANVGETIRVRNPSSKRVVVARVLSNNQVEVMY